MYPVVNMSCTSNTRLASCLASVQIVCVQCLHTNHKFNCCNIVGYSGTRCHQTIPTFVSGQTRIHHLSFQRSLDHYGCVVWGCSLAWSCNIHGNTRTHTSQIPHDKTVHWNHVRHKQVACCCRLLIDKEISGYPQYCYSLEIPTILLQITGGPTVILKNIPCILEPRLFYQNVSIFTYVRCIVDFNLANELCYQAICYY